MLPMRLILPLHASMASHSMVFPDEAWPTTAKLRMSAGDVVAISWNPSWNENARNSSRAQAESLNAALIASPHRRTGDRPGGRCTAICCPAIVEQQWKPCSHRRTYGYQAYP